MASAAALYAPHVVLGELYYGALRDNQLEQVRRFLQAAVGRGDERDLWTHSQRASASAGLPIPENDIWIAAFALQHGLPLATRDQHFGRIANLTILGW